ncbi:DMT family transporter [Zhongshania sp.]|uniref:DMT family transporter n=1 Tax=Zhongshania sp. TaxID=1971902 RepID=UPI0025CDAF00|nr:DMT family transporter [Zhongshania sp.]
MNNAYKSDLLLVLVTLLASISWMFSKEAVLQMPPLLFMSIRFSLAALLLSCASYRALGKLAVSAWLHSARVGLVFGIAMCFWVTGLAKASHVGEAAFLASLGVVMVPIIGRALFKEAIPTSTWVALPVALIGLGFLSLSAPMDHALKIETSHILLLSSAALFALYFNLNARVTNIQSFVRDDGEEGKTNKIPVLALTTIVLATTGIITGLASAILEPWQPTVSDMHGELVVWILLSATIGTALRFLVQTYAQSLTANSHGVVIMVLEPLWTTLIAMAWFGESMNASQLVGCLFILLSLVINRLKAITQLLRLG